MTRLLVSFFPEVCLKVVLIPGAAMSGFLSSPCPFFIQLQQSSSPVPRGAVICGCSGSSLVCSFEGQALLVPADSVGPRAGRGHSLTMTAF